jgi:hypothetical protein
MLSHNHPCMGGGSTRLFVRHRLLITYKMLLMVAGRSLEASGKMSSSNHA